MWAAVSTLLALAVAAMAAAAGAAAGPDWAPGTATAPEWPAGPTAGVLRQWGQRAASAVGAHFSKQGALVPNVMLFHSFNPASFVSGMTGLVGAAASAAAAPAASTGAFTHPNPQDEAADEARERQAGAAAPQAPSVLDTAAEQVRQSDPDAGAPEAATGAHGQCEGGGAREQCPGYDDNVHSQQICESLLCCWKPAAETWVRSCFARSPPPVQVNPGHTTRNSGNPQVTGATSPATQPSAGSPAPPPGSGNGLFGGQGTQATGTNPLSPGACAGDRGVCFHPDRASCVGATPLGPALCGQHAADDSLRCCPTGATLEARSSAATGAGQGATGAATTTTTTTTTTSSPAGSASAANTAPGGLLDPDETGPDNLAAEAADPLANGDTPESDGQPCGAYANSEQVTIQGNNGPVVCVKILPQHFVGSSDNHIMSGAACAFDRMFEAAKAKGVTLAITSGFRTLKRQQHFWDSHGCARRQKGARRCPNGPLAARPGTSKHGVGYALDISTSCGEQGGNSPPSLCMRTQPYVWLRENAATYGWARSVRSEPWHYEFRPDGAVRPGWA